MNIKKIIQEAHIPNYASPSLEDTSYVLLSLSLGVIKRSIYELILFNIFSEENEKMLIDKGVKMIEGKLTIDSYIKELEKTLKKESNKDFKFDDALVNQITMRLQPTIEQTTKKLDLTKETSKSIKKDGTLKKESYSIVNNKEEDLERSLTSPTEADKKALSEDNIVKPKVITYSQLKDRLQPLLGVANVTKYDIRSLTFVGTKAQVTKIYKIIEKLGLQDYFDYPCDDSDFSGRGTWYINAQDALDNGLIVKDSDKKALSEDHLDTRDSKIEFIIRNQEWIPETNEAFTFAYHDGFEGDLDTDLETFLNREDDESIDSLYHTIERLMDEQGVDSKNESTLKEDNTTESRIDPRFLALPEKDRVIVLKAIGELRLPFDGVVTRQTVDKVVQGFKKHYDKQSPQMKYIIDTLLTTLDPNDFKKFTAKDKEIFLNSELRESKITPEELQALEKFARDYDLNINKVKKEWKFSKENYKNVSEYIKQVESNRDFEFLESVIEEANILEPQSKDYMRITDLIRKGEILDAKGRFKAGVGARQLAQTMANKITDISKAYRRYKAAEEENFHDLALIFYKRYRDLEKHPVSESTLQESTLEVAKKEAQEISEREGVVQHVNEENPGEYKVSDWYDSDTTIVSYENGEQL